MFICRALAPLLVFALRMVNPNCELPPCSTLEKSSWLVPPMSSTGVSDGLPVPLKVTSVELGTVVVGSLCAIVSVALRAPTAPGVKVTVTVQLVRGAESVPARDVLLLQVPPRL